MVTPPGVHQGHTRVTHGLRVGDTWITCGYRTQRRTHYTLVARATTMLTTAKTIMKTMILLKAAIMMKTGMPMVASWGTDGDHPRCT